MKEETKETQIAAVTGGYVPAAMQSIESGVLVPNQALDIRANLKGGAVKFTIGGEGDEGRSIQFHIFDMRRIVGIRPSETYSVPSDFTQLIGLMTFGTKKVLANVTFGGTAAETVADIIPLLKLKSDKLGCLEFICEITLEETSNKKKQKFGVARISYRKATQDEIALAITAIETNADACFRFRDMPNIDEKEATA